MGYVDDVGAASSNVFQVAKKAVVAAVLAGVSAAGVALQADASAVSAAVGALISAVVAGVPTYAVRNKVRRDKALR